jgi:hypothetical protein
LLAAFPPDKSCTAQANKAQSKEAHCPRFWNRRDTLKLKDNVIEVTVGPVVNVRIFEAHDGPRQIR